MDMKSNLNRKKGKKMQNIFKDGSKGLADIDQDRPLSRPILVKGGRVKPFLGLQKKGFLGITPSKSLKNSR